MKTAKIVTKIEKETFCYPSDSNLHQHFLANIQSMDEFESIQEELHSLLKELDSKSRHVNSVLSILQQIASPELEYTPLILDDIERPIIQKVTKKSVSNIKKPISTTPKPVIIPRPEIIKNENNAPLLTHTRKSTNKTTSSKKNTQQIEGNTQEDQSIKQCFQLFLTLGTLAAMFVISEQNKKIHQPVRIASPVEVIMQNRSAQPDESKFGRLDNIIQHIEENNAFKADRRLSINIIVNYIYNQVHSETSVRIKTINMNFHSLNSEDQKRYSTRYKLAEDGFVNVNANVLGFVASGIFYPTQIDYTFEVI